MRHSGFIQISPSPFVPLNYSVQSVPLVATTPMYQSLIQISQPQPQIVRQRPINVVDLEQYDDIWRKKVEDLEKQLRELQKQKPQPVAQVSEPIIELRAGADAEDLERYNAHIEEFYRMEYQMKFLILKQINWGNILFNNFQQDALL